MRLISTKICKTSDIGVNSNLFGGVMLVWLDEAGGILSSELSCSPNMITLKMDEEFFKKPVKVNNHIRIYGKPVGVGNSTVSLYLEARRFCFETFKEITVCSTKMLYVKVDENGNSAPIDEIMKKNLIQKIEKQNQYLS
jgi:acyl-CoA thioesterase YciA